MATSFARYMMSTPGAARYPNVLASTGAQRGLFKGSHVLSDAGRRSAASASSAVRSAATAVGRRRRGGGYQESLFHNEKNNKNKTMNKTINKTKKIINRYKRSKNNKTKKIKKNKKK